MKLHSKLLVAVMIMALSMNTLIPGTAFAKENENEANSQGRGIGSGNFCTKVGNIKVDQQISTKIAQLEKNYQKHSDQLEQKREKHDTDFTNKHERKDINQERRFSRLRGIAQTDLQKAAVEKFIQQLNTAQDARKTAIEMAIKNFRDAVDKTLLPRQTALNTVMENYQKAVTTALDKAKADCLAGGDSTTVRNSFVNALKIAKTKMEAEKRAIDKLKDTIKNLIAVKKSAIAKAQSDFKKAVESARVEMLKAFPPEPEESESEIETETPSSS